MHHRIWRYIFRMKLNWKRTLAALLAPLMLSALIFGCAPKPSGNVGGSDVLGSESAKGRYMESPLLLDLPEGVTRLAVIGMGAVEGGVELFSVPHSGEGITEPVYYRHTLKSDGTQSCREEPWLAEYMKHGGNQMSVQRGADGALYGVWGDYDEAGNMLAHILVSRDDGKTATELMGDGIKSLKMITDFAAMQDGRLVIADWDANGLCVLDAEGNRIQELETSRLQSSIAIYGNKIATIAPEGKAVRIYDLSDGSHVDWAYEIGKRSTHLTFAQDGALYLADATGIHRHALDGTLWEGIVDGSSASMGISNNYLTSLAVAGGERDELYVSIYKMDGASELFRYAFDPEAARTADIELNVFSLYDNEIVRNAIVAFSRVRSDVKVNYTATMKMKGGGTEQDYIKALNTELLAGNGPDVILLDGLPADSYVEKGVLQDLSAIVDGAEPMLENVRKAYEKDGKLYSVPLALGVPLVLARSGGYATLDELAGSADSLSKKAFTPSALGKLILTYYGEELYSAGDEAAARAFLEKVKRIAEAAGVTANSLEELSIGWGLPGTQMMELIGEDSFTPQLATYRNESDAMIFNVHAVGDMNFAFGAGAAEQLGGELSGIGDKFIAEGLLGINKAGKHPEETAQFVQMLLSAGVQGTSAYQHGFPVNAAALDAMMAFENDNVSMALNFDNERKDFFSAEWPSEAIREKLKTIIRGLKTPLRSDSALEELLLSELVACIEGGETPESAAPKVFSKLSAYRSE